VEKIWGESTTETDIPKTPKMWKTLYVRGYIAKNGVKIAIFVPLGPFVWVTFDLGCYIG
jgi:hypothetical protein